jgi:preprotein translocase subunit YajC
LVTAVSSPRLETPNRRIVRGGRLPTRRPAAAGKEGSARVDWIIFALPVLLLVLMFSSQRKRQRSVQQLQASLQPGQQVVTTSGLFARIVQIDDAVAVLEIGPGLRVRWDRRAIGGVVADDAPGALPAAGAPPATAHPASPPSDPRPGEPGAPVRPADEI